MLNYVEDFRIRDTHWIADATAKTVRTGSIDVLLKMQMGSTLTIRLPENLAAWLDEAARKTGKPRGRVVRLELEKARRSSKQPFMHLAGAVESSPTLSVRKGFSRN